MTTREILEAAKARVEEGALMMEALRASSTPGDHYEAWLALRNVAGEPLSIWSIDHGRSEWPWLFDRAIAEAS